MWVAKNRQKPPEENAFAKRARRKRGAPSAPAPEVAPEPYQAPEPATVADQMPDLAALREAAQAAAELVNATTPKAASFERNPESAEYAQAPDIATVPEAEPAEVQRGRKPSTEVQERKEAVLRLVREAGSAGIKKAELAAVMELKETQVSPALAHWQQEGKVENRRMPETREFRWFAL
jgi:hypothetical protein